MKDINELVYSELEKIALENAKRNLMHANMVAKEVHPKDSLYVRYIKRMIDFVVALICLIITLPINLVIGILTYISLGSPLFFRQARVTKGGRIFYLTKFRNMTMEKDQNGELLPPSQRITPFGKFIRKTSLDELLNFYSILKGDMSIIGPRPLPDFYSAIMSERHKKRTLVRAGLECPILNKDIERLDWEARFENDIWYVENCSFIVDLKMFFKLIQLVCFSKGTIERANADTSPFIGYDENGKAIGVSYLSIEYINDVLKK